MNPTMIITLIMTVAFFTIMLLIGVRARSAAKDVSGFVLGSRSVGPWLSAFAYGTSYFSAVIFVGYAGQFGWNFGLASTWIGLGNAFIGSLLAWLILGRRTRIMTNHLGCKTMPEFFGTRFRSSSLKLAASVITFVFLIPYTASLYNGLSRLFAMAFPGVNYAVCVIAMAVLTGTYVVIGGYMATAWNDFIQGMLMLFGIVAVIGAVLRDNGGLNAAVEQLATGENGGWQYASFFGADPLFLLFVVLLTSLGTWGLPQMVGKFYAIKNEEAVKKGTVISTLFAIVVAGGCYFLGGFGRLYNVDVAADGFDAIIPAMLSTLSPFIIGVVIVLVLSASMSTLSSLVLTSSSTITLDLIDPLLQRQAGRAERAERTAAADVSFDLRKDDTANADADTEMVFASDSARTRNAADETGIISVSDSAELRNAARGMIFDGGCDEFGNAARGAKRWSGLCASDAAREKLEQFREKRRMRIMRVFIAIFIVISALIAIRQVNNKSLFIAQMMGVSWGALAGAFLAPFLYGLYSRKITRASVWVSFVFGVGLETAQLLVSLGVLDVSAGSALSFVFRNSLYSGVFAMIGGLVLVPVISALTSEDRPDDVDSMFRCYEQTEVVGITEHLGK